MAVRTKGLTVTIDGDTTGLTKALAEVNKEVKNTQAQLKDIDKLLKLDPGNTELLTQKQKALGSAVSETKQKLDTLKTAASQANEALAKGDISQEQYDGLQREIIETEEKLKSLEQEYQKFGSVQAQQVAAAGEKMKELGSNVESAGKTLTTGVTVPLAAVGAAGAASFAEVDKTMALTNKTMGNTAEEAKLLNDAMKSAAANSVYGMSDAATATLNFARAGLDAEQAAGALAPAMNLAAGEGGNLDTVSGGLVATINGFHGSFDDAGHYADVFAAACNNSALDVDSLSGAMSIAAPIFSSAGYSVNDAALYMGVMANNGIEANKAANSLKTGIARLVSPAAEGAVMMDKLGISVTNADGTMKSSVQIQRELHEAFSQLSESEQIAAASAIFGKTQMAPWLALINTAPEDVMSLSVELDGASLSTESFSQELEKSGTTYDDMKGRLEKLGISGDAVDVMFKTCEGDAQLFMEGLLEAADAGVTMDDVAKALGISMEDLQAAIDNTKGTTDVMAEAMMSGFGGSIEKLKSSIDVLVYSIGEALAPTIQKVIDFIQGLVDKFNALTPAQQQMIVTAGMVAAALGPVLIVVGKLMQAIGSIMAMVPAIQGAITAAQGALSGLAGAIGLPAAAIAGIVAAIGGLVAAFVTLWNTNEEFRAKMTEIWSGIVETLAGFFKGIGDRLSELGINFTSVTDALKAAWEAFCNVLAPVFEGAFQTIAVVLKSVTDAILGILDIFIGLFTGNWEQAWKGVQEVFGAVWDLITGLLQTAIDTITGIADAFLSMFGTSWEQTWTSVKEFFANAWEGIKSVAGTATEAVKTAVSTAWEAIKTGTSTAWEAVKTGVSNAWEKMKNVASTSADAVKNKVSAAWNNLKSESPAAWNTIKTSVANAAENMKTSLSKALGNMQSNASNVLGGLKNTFSTGWETIKSTVGTIMQSISSGVLQTWNNVKSGVANTITGIATTIASGLSSAANVVRNMASNAFSWGRDIIAGMIRGIASAVGSLVNAVANIANTIRSYLHFSVPDVGPLTDYESWMPDFMGTLAKGIEEGRGLIKGAMENVSMDMVLSPSAGGMASASVANGGGHDSGIASLLGEYLPYLPQLAQMQMVTDTGALVGQLAPAMNTQLGVIATRGRRQ